MTYYLQTLVTRASSSDVEDLYQHLADTIDLLIPLPCEILRPVDRSGV